MQINWQFLVAVEIVEVFGEILLSFVFVLLLASFGLQKLCKQHHQLPEPRN